MGWWQETKADVRKSLKWAFSKSTESKNESEEYEEIRTRDKKGQYVGDDKSTPDVNEAYTRRKKR